jgi:hypothetical protein
MRSTRKETSAVGDSICSKHVDLKSNRLALCSASISDLTLEDVAAALPPEPPPETETSTED